MAPVKRLPREVKTVRAYLNNLLKERDSDMVDLFAEFDGKNQDGLITKPEFHKALRTVGASEMFKSANTMRAFIDDLYNELDASGDGRVAFTEFNAWVSVTSMDLNSHLVPVRRCVAAV